MPDGRRFSVGRTGRSARRIINLTVGDASVLLTSQAEEQGEMMMTPPNILTVIQRTAFAFAALGAVEAAAADGTGVGHPVEARFGETVDAISQSLEAVCSSQVVRAIDPPQAPGASSQTQIDCLGFDYFNAPRKAEFVFADDALILIWILTEKSEEDALIDAFEAEFGAPTHDNDGVTAFADDRAAVRKDVPEALYYGEAVAEAVRAQFDQLQ